MTLEMAFLGWDFQRRLRELDIPTPIEFQLSETLLKIPLFGFFVTAVHFHMFYLGAVQLVCCVWT